MKTLTPRQNHSDSCFEATLEVASETMDAVVIHGWLRNRDSWILHAWCEVDERVIDLTETRKPIDKSAYYRIMGVTPERSIRYDRQAFFALAAEHGHFGPFDRNFFFSEAASGDPLQHMARQGAATGARPRNTAAGASQIQGTEDPLPPSGT
jgi:hypothetical protein